MGGHRCKEYILCRVVESSCLLTHNIAPHISWHDHPLHKNMKHTKNSEYWSFLFWSVKIAIRTWFCNCQQYLFFISHCLWVHAKFSWSRKDTSLFRGVRTGIPNWKPSPNLAAVGFSQIASHNCPAKKWPYRFRSRGTIGSSKLDLDLDLCHGGRIQMSGFSDFFDFSNNLWAPSIFGFKRILHPLLVLRTLAVWIWCEWLLLLSFEMLMNLVQWILHTIQNHLSHCRFEVQLYLCTFGALPPIRKSSNDMSINDAKWTFSLFALASSITSF